MLENVRYEPGEESKDEAERGALADRYAALGDVFVSDGFGVVHRKQARVYDLASRLPERRRRTGQGRGRGAQAADRGARSRPYVVVLGGAKVSDKLAVIANLLKTADTLVVGGGMVFTFLAAQGHEVGKSLLEADQIETVKGYLDEAAAERQADRAADRHRRRAGVQGRRAAHRGRRRRDPRRPAGSRHRPGVGPGVRRRRRAGEDGVLERPDGRRRVGGLRRRHPGRRAGPHRGRRPLGRRRRRLRGRRARPRLRRRRLRPHLHRRRRQPGVPGGQDPARARRARHHDAGKA